MFDQTKHLIGIVGGMGPAAGIDLAEKIIKNTIARCDQDHLPQILYTDARYIGDRSEYILGKTKVNPAFAIADVLLKLESMGVKVAGLPCNSAHASEIFKVVIAEIEKRGSTLKLLNMIEEVGAFIKSEYEVIKKIGIIGTSGTYLARQYDQLRSIGFETFYVSEEEQQKVHEAIYNSIYGIKACSNPISYEALEIINSAIQSLQKSGAEAIVLACTELALINTKEISINIPVIDSTLVLARALIKFAAPQKLTPFTC